MSELSRPGPAPAGRRAPSDARYRWAILALGILAQTAFAAVIQGLPALGPALKNTFDLSLPELGLVLAALTVGAASALVPWGIATDRWGERLALFLGLGGCALALVVSTLTQGVVALGVVLFAAGTLGGVTSVASGRAVMSWFDAEQRGTALGLRQTAVPLGGALGALVLPALVVSSNVDNGLLALAIACGLAAGACGMWLRDRERADEIAKLEASPTRDRRIWVLGLGGCLLIFSQISVVTFVVIFLVEERGFTPAGAGIVLAAIQLIGAAARVAVGRWSDTLARRIYPLRRLALGIFLSWAAVFVLFEISANPFVVVLVVAGALSVSWNGLSFTAAAEFAGTGRSGTAIGLQQTILFAAGSVTAPAFGALVEAIDWRLAFATLALTPLAAWFVLRPLDRAEVAVSAPPV